MTPLRSDRGVARSLDWALIVSWLALVLTRASIRGRAMSSS